LNKPVNNKTPSYCCLTNIVGKVAKLVVNFLSFWEARVN